MYHTKLKLKSECHTGLGGPALRGYPKIQWKIKVITNRMNSITPIKMRIKTGVLLTKSFQSDFFHGELNLFGGVFIILG